MKKKRTISIIGAIILVMGFTAYHLYYQIIGSVCEVLYWMPNMVGLALLLYGVGLHSNKLSRHLIFYPASMFFGMLDISYTFNLFVDFVINVNFVIYCLISFNTFN